VRKASQDYCKGRKVLQSVRVTEKGFKLDIYTTIVMTYNEKRAD